MGAILSGFLNIVIIKFVRVHTRTTHPHELAIRETSTCYLNHCSPGNCTTNLSELTQEKIVPFNFCKCLVKACKGLVNVLYSL